MAQGSMRVVSGTARGRRLAAPPGIRTRPTPNRVRGAVFNSLYSLGLTEGARVLDLYAGTGALGIEALSRGAAEAVFVERDPTVVAVLRANVETTGFVDRATVMAVDAFSALDGLIRQQRHFDLALADPPYAFDRWPELLALVPADIVAIESDRDIEVSSNLGVHHRMRHGGTVVTFAVAVERGLNPSGACQ